MATILLSEKSFTDTVYEKLQTLDYFNIKCVANSQQCLLISHKELFDHPPFGYTSRCRIVITEDHHFVVNVLMREVEKGQMATADEAIVFCQKYSPYSSIHKFCPGLDVTQYERYRELIKFDIKGTRKTLEPFLHVDSTSCLLWFEIGNRASAVKKESELVLCPPCVKLKCNFEYQVRQTKSESPSKKLKRQDPSSNARLSYMSPKSQKKRKISQRLRLDGMKRKLRRYKHTDVILDEEQHAEMSSIVDRVNESFSKEMNELLAEGEKHGVASQLRDVWNSDVQKDLTSFQYDQSMNKTGKKNNNWSSITIRMALAVFVRSPATYEALKGFNVLQLPSRFTLQSYTGAFLHSHGANSSSIVDQVAQFVLFCQQNKKEGKPESLKEGVLIFDEVKVISRLMWNSRSQSIIGTAMDYHDMSSLADIYQFIEKDEAAQTSHILQFLWRDLTSSFDIVGPYFPYSMSMESKFLYNCIMETLQLFQLHGLKTSLLVSDGASTNLTVLKATHGQYGVYPITLDETPCYEISPWMVNPYNPPSFLYWIICPSHQLKNMVNALFSSRTNGSKAFELDGVTFGWEQISMMYDRECQRVKEGLTRMIPKMKETYIIRDAWTKLNVAPAKIMQQEHVLSELHNHIHKHPNDIKTQQTLKYLEACNKIFENGFLSLEKVLNMDSKVIKSIEDGFQFFTTWLDQILGTDSAFDIKDASQKKYISWQTFDLLRVDVYGFTAFCRDFLKRHPGYYISPLRISGSAVESLFSQYKYSAGGKLDSANYVTSRAANLIKQVVPNHHSGKGYRDQSTSTPVIPLKKTDYNVKSH